MKWFLVFVLSLSGCTSARQATDISELLDVPPMPRSVPPGVTAIVDRPANARTITRYSLSELLEGAQNVSEEDGFLKNIKKLEGAR